MTSRSDIPPLRLITVFDTVYRCGSLQRAATELGVSQSAVSQAIKQLEDFMGAPLLNRDTRPASLTEAGLHLQQGVSKGLEQIGNAVAEVRALLASHAQSLTVACTVGTATYWLMPCLTGFHERHAEAAISVHTVASGPPRIAPGIDVAIRYGLGDWNEGPTRLLFRERVVPVCAPERYAQLADRAFQMDDMPLLHVDSGYPNWLGWPEYFERSGIKKPARAGLVFTNYVQATQAALAGQGILLGWRSMVGEFVKVGKLAELPLPSVIPQESFYLVSPERPRNAQLQQQLVDWLLKAGLAIDVQV